MRRTGLAALLALVAAVPAAASGGLYCEGDGAAVDLKLGRLAVLAVIDAAVTAGGETWVTSPHLGEGTPITIGQAFGDAGVIAVDITDDIVNDIVARLRLFTAEGAEGPVTGGTLEVVGRDAWVVSCMELG